MLLLLSLMFAIGCRSKSGSTESDSRCDSLTNAIYHWKSTFAPNEQEWEFLRKHNVRRLYIRMFDVVLEHSEDDLGYAIVPIATTHFNESLSARCKDIEIIPTTYITLEALREMKGKERYYAELIVERLRAMASYNGCGKIQEIQFDCDWTSSTQQSYFDLCDISRSLLKADSIILSSTIRLHQLSATPPPVDRGVLMLYNTGNLKSAKTENSILDVDDVKPYLKRASYSLPLDYAYPTFGWGVKFCNENFVAIVSNPEQEELGPYESIRVERSSIQDVMEVKRLVEKSLGKPASCNILYHLDKEQLKLYTDEEIADIYSCR